MTFFLRCAIGGSHVVTCVEGMKNDIMAYFRSNPMVEFDWNSSHIITLKQPKGRQHNNKISSVAYARVGIAGNPSDGYGGMTLGATIANFHATVTITPNPPPDNTTIRFMPQPEADLEQFSSCHRLVEYVHEAGYDGGIRLLVATTKVFLDACQKFNWCLPTPHGFIVTYSTNIPRQRGLAGSSAIATAMFRSLCAWYGVHFHPVDAAEIVLSAEKDELKIAAGLQDRIAQSFEGCIMMDFSRKQFQVIDNVMLNNSTVQWFLAFPTLDKGKTSGGVHATVRSRWEAGEGEARQIMSDIANLAPHALHALQAQDWPRLAHVMNTNFDLRCKLFGPAVGAADTATIMLARSVGAAAKLPGSGGTVLIFCPSHEIAARLRHTFHDSGIPLETIAWHGGGGGSSML